MGSVYMVSCQVLTNSSQILEVVHYDYLKLFRSFISISGQQILRKKNLYSIPQ